MKTDTFVNHPPIADVASDNPPLVAPIYNSVKFTLNEFDDAQRMQRGERDAYFYSRVSNPTLVQLEQTLARLQQRSGCVLAASGVAAMSMTLQALCSQGDHLLLCAEGYMPTRAVVRRVLARYGVRFTVVSVEDHAGIEKILREIPTRAVVFESPTNPVLKVADIERLCALAHANDCLAVLDNTLAGVHAHGQFPVDIFVHSLTKYANGHGDVLAGAVMANEPLITRLRHEFLTMGSMLDPHAAFMIQRGMKTYVLRYERACDNALQVARMLADHPAVQQVRYPGLPSHPQHALAMQQTGTGGGIVTFHVHGDETRANAVVAKLKLFKLAASLGSTESLVLPPSMLQARDLQGDAQRWAQIDDTMIRLSIGIEDIDDLWSDLQQALM